MIYAIVIILLLIAAYVFLIAPKACPKDAMRDFANRNYAHRGLYSQNQSVPENSLAAFRAAADKGYGVELDVQFTLDKRLVVFHDDDLKRACGVDKRVDQLTFDQLQQLSLFGTEHKIPLFCDVMAVLNRVPVIVEIKSTHDYAPLCAAVATLLDEHEGVYCVESFDPRMVAWFRRNRPRVTRGQLSEHFKGWHKSKGFLYSLCLSRLLSNVYTRPHFIAFGNNGRRNLSVLLNRAMGAMLVSWTVRPTDDYDWYTSRYEAIIFEHFEPQVRYKR